MTQLKNINRYFSVIDNSLFMTTGNLDYDRITDAIIKLSNAVNDYDGDNDDMWCIGEYGSCDLTSLIIGAYWHYTEWHAGQWSKSYAALSALSQIYQPGMTSIESESPEFEAYRQLDDMAKFNNNPHRTKRA